jgi:hypothetical protein
MSRQYLAGAAIACTGLVLAYAPYGTTKPSSPAHIIGVTSQHTYRAQIKAFPGADAPFTRRRASQLDIRLRGSKTSFTSSRD